MLDFWFHSIKYHSLNDNNSAELAASFVLLLNKPMPVCAKLVQQIHELVYKTGEGLIHTKVGQVNNLLKYGPENNPFSP